MELKGGNLFTHKTLSYTKSASRCVAYLIGASLAPGIVSAIFWILFAAEVLGVLEESFV